MKKYLIYYVSVSIEVSFECQTIMIMAQNVLDNNIIIYRLPLSFPNDKHSDKLFEYLSTEWRMANGEQPKRLNMSQLVPPRIPDNTN